MTRVLGIDVGGTKTAFGILDLTTGAVLARRSIPTPNPAGPVFLETLVITAREMGPVAATGLGLCELVGPGGQPDSGHRVDWRGLDPAGQLRATVQADIRCAAMAEARMGAGRSLPDFLFVNIGTGISACWVPGGVPHGGTHGHGLAIANSPMSGQMDTPGVPPRTPGYLHNDENQVCLEDIAGGSGLGRLWGAGGTVALLAAAAEGDPRAGQLLDTAAAGLGAALGVAVNLLDPAAVIFGGGLGRLPGPYHDRIVAALRGQIYSDRVRGLPILRSALGPDAGWLGAALYAADASPEGG